MKSAFNFITRLPRFVLITVTAVVIVGIGTLIYHGTHSASASAAPRAARAAQQVTVASVASLSPINDPLSVVGLVTSEDEATVLSQTSGEIVNVAVHLGDK